MEIHLPRSARRISAHTTDPASHGAHRGPARGLHQPQASRPSWTADRLVGVATPARYHRLLENIRPRSTGGTLTLCRTTRAQAPGISDKIAGSPERAKPNR